jgi:predicted ATP-binding protein involved in virulence
MYLQKAIFKNVAPFGDLELTFDQNDVIVFSGINGRGKTTILSYIADAFFEIARKAQFQGVLKDPHKYYRIISSSNILRASHSLVYFRFVDDEHSYIDYIEISGLIDKSDYNSYITLENKISFEKFNNTLITLGSYKGVNVTNAVAKELLTKNILTYFPSDRSEIPVWLSDSEYRECRFNIKTRFSDHLNKNIEARNISDQVTNWILDVILDGYVQNVDSFHGTLYSNINAIIAMILSEKVDNCRFGISPRNRGNTRVSIVKDEKGGNVTLISPSIFHLSSGEISLLMLFSEILRQYDAYAQSSVFNLADIKGIVIVDEIEKHLHIKLQKEELPKLIKMFPHVQFFTSSQSPFFCMGLAEELQEKSKIIDLQNDGISIKPEKVEEYEAVYKMMIAENDRFKELYHLFEQKIKEGTVPLIVTEGKTDVLHIKKTKEKLNITDCDLDFFEVPEDGWGSSKLKTLLENISKIPNARQIIGIFDRDEDKILTDIEKNDQPFKNYGNNVFAFCIPVPTSRKDYNNISIEFYYTDDELKTNKDGKCLYFDNEVERRSPGSNRKASKLHKLDSKIEEYELNKKIIDENIGDLDWIHSKSVFADLVANDADFAKNFNFENYKLIFDKIKSITHSTG